MSYYSFRRLDQILKNKSFGTTRSLDQIQAIDWKCWTEIAGNSIAAHTQVVLNGRSGIVYADSPVWAHTVNQQRIRLLKAMRNKGFSIDSLQVRSRPLESIRKNKKIEKKPSAIPVEARQAIEETAKEIEHEQLRLALLRLSRFGQKEN